MDIRQLRYFLAVVDNKGFTKAADQLLIAQPSLSETIKGLERELGVSLFHRIGRGVVLSEAGQELVGPARVVLRDLEVARSAVGDLRGIRTGRLDVLAMPSPGVEPLTSMIAKFTKEHSSVTISVEAAFTPEAVAEGVRNGAAEIGILGAGRPFRSADVDVMYLEQQPLVLVVNPEADAFAEHRQVVLREDLAGHKIVVSKRGSLMRWLVDDILAGGVNAEVAVEVAHRTSFLPLVLAGVGHAIMPTSWTSMARQLGLRVVGIDPPSLLHVALLSRRSDLTPAALAFRAVAAEYATDRHHSSGTADDDARSAG